MIGPRRNSLAVGVTAATTAGLIWGLAFLVPVVLDAWNPVIVTGGRYLAYGVVAGVLFLMAGRDLRRIVRRHWRPALLYAITGNVGYYLLLVVGIHTIGAPVTDMVIGCIPVALAVVGNVVLPGLTIVNALELAGTHAYSHAPTGHKLAGLAAASGAVALWTWYGIANTRFLTEHRSVSPAAWSTIVGVATGILTLAALPLAWATGQVVVPSVDGSGAVVALILGTAILGVVVSWGGTSLWNAASRRLPPTIAGLLINVETLAGYAYVYAARQQWPPTGQLAGFALILLGVALVLYRQPPAEVTTLGAHAHRQQSSRALPE